MVNPGGTGISRLVMFASPAPFPPNRSFIFPDPSAFPSPKKYTCRFALLAICGLRNERLMCYELGKKKDPRKSAAPWCLSGVIIMNRRFEFQRTTARGIASPGQRFLLLLLHRDLLAYGRQFLRVRFLSFQQELPCDDDPDGKHGLRDVDEGMRGLERLLDQGVRDHHLARHLPQDGGADVDDDRVFVHQHGEKRAGPHDERDAEPQPEKQKEHVPFRRPGDRQHIVQAHDDIRDDDQLDRLPDVSRFPDFFLLVSLHQELHRDPGDQRSADEFQEGDFQHLRREKGASHPQEHRGSRAQDDPPLSLLPLKTLDRHGDHDGIVSRQDQVDHDDAQQPGEKHPVHRYVPEPAQIPLRGDFPDPTDIPHCVPPHSLTFIVNQRKRSCAGPPDLSRRQRSAAADVSDPPFSPDGTAYFAFIASQQREIAFFRDAFASAAPIGAYPNPSLANLSSSRQWSARKALPVHFSLGMLRISEREPVTSRTISATSSQVT